MEKADIEEPGKDEVDVTKAEEEKKEKDLNGASSSKTEKEKDDAAEASGAAASKQKKNSKASKCKKHDDKKNKKKKAAKSSKRSKRHSSPSSDSDSDASADSDSDSDSADSDSDTSSSEDEKTKKKRKAHAKRKAAQKKKKEKAKKHKKSKKHDSSDDSSDSSSDSSDAGSESDASSVVEHATRRRRGSARSRRGTVVHDTTTEAEETGAEDSWEADAETAARLQEQLNALHLSIQSRQLRAARTKARVTAGGEQVVVVERSRSRRRDRKDKKKDKKEKEKEKKGKKAGGLEFKRVDELWDTNIHDWTIKESAAEQEDQFTGCVFTVRRRFNWENKYRDTLVDIKSKPLREALQTIMKDVKSVSLVEEEPCIDPNALFLHLEETRTYYKKTIKAMIKKTKKRKELKRLKLIRSHVKVLIDYLDEDYGETKKKLYPLLEAGNITFDLLWALFKPNTLAYTTTYGSVDDPRCFKVDYAFKEQNFLRGEWYSIEGRYLEYDGKHFGLGDFSIDVDQFKGPRKITSLATYPLEYHKDPEKVKEQLVERGKKFVMMQGMNYKFHKGLAFVKKKKAVAKVTINGRVMIDPAIFRRINPNYPISVIKPKSTDDMMSDDEDECSECGCGSESSDEAAGGNVFSKDKDDEQQKMAWKVIWDKNNEPQFVRVPVDEDGQIVKPENLEKLPNGDAKDDAKTPQVFSEEELLIASPVVLGFSFKEKLWLEFSLSGIKEIEWNEEAFESLVIPTNQKSIVKALVSSHKFHAAETIDDVVQGKGKGLVFVLHGPPGVGKTLTGEGIAEMLRCPLYAVSAGELGMDQRNIEHELQKIMDIAHSWGAVLLLDEADVFLEKRQIQDVGRNAMVSIFLRLLEYFQGILFLTTNRVETFDEAFQSRIHVALKYEELGHKAKKEIWKMFLNKVKVMEGTETAGFSEKDYELLARNNMNGRQIKNAVRTAQALAVNERQKLSMEHIERVLAVAESFDRDMRGLTLDAMKQYV